MDGNRGLNEPSTFRFKQEKLTTKSLEKGKLNLCQLYTKLSDRSPWET